MERHSLDGVPKSEASDSDESFLKKISNVVENRSTEKELAEGPSKQNSDPDEEPPDYTTDLTLMKSCPRGEGQTRHLTGRIRRRSIRERYCNRRT